MCLFFSFPFGVDLELETHSEKKVKQSQVLRDYSVGFRTELDIALISVDSEKDSVLNYVFGFS